MAVAGAESLRNLGGLVFEVVQERDDGFVVRGVSDVRGFERGSLRRSSASDSGGGLERGLDPDEENQTTFSEVSRTAWVCLEIVSSSL